MSVQDPKTIADPSIFWDMLALQLDLEFIIFDTMKLTAQEEKLRSELIERLQSVESPDLLREVREILDRSEPQKDFWDELSAKQQSIVKKGMAELKEGKGIAAERISPRGA